jgi:hypothetical protein
MATSLKLLGSSCRWNDASVVIKSGNKNKKTAWNADGFLNIDLIVPINFRKSSTFCNFFQNSLLWLVPRLRALLSGEMPAGHPHENGEPYNINWETYW